MNELTKMLQDIVENISDIRHRATISCVTNPMLWVATHGVPLSVYLEQLDKLEDVSKKVIEKFGSTEES